MFSRNVYAAAILLIAGGLGCADAGHGDENITPFAPHEVFADAEDMGDDLNANDGVNNQEEPDNSSQEPEPEVYLLEALGDTSLQAATGNTTSLGVRLINGESEAVSDEAIRYEVIDSPPGSGTQMDAATVISDDDGEASNNLRVGQAVGAITVRASHEEVDDPVDFFVDVTTEPPGDMRVSVDYDTPDLMEITDVGIQIWKTSRLDCGLVDPFSTQAEPSIDEGLLPTVSDDVTFEELEANPTYTVLAVGHGPQDQVSAAGCVDDVPIQGDDLTDVVVPIHLIDLLPMGTYEVVSVWDFTEALAASGPVGAAITDAFDWIADPGQTAAGYVVDLAVDWVCDEDNYGSGSFECLAAIAAGASAEGTVADFINDQIDSIGILSDFQTMAEDLKKTVEEMTIESLLTINRKMGAQGEVSGLDIWQAATFYWTQDCDANSPPDCGEIRLDLGSGTNYGVLQSTWEGRIYDYDQLEIYPHSMDFPYGQFITQILNETLIPALTDGNANSLSEAFEYMLCGNIGEIEIWGVVIPEATVQAFCTSAFSGLGSALEIYINSLAYDVDLDISGGGHLIDLESDRWVDVIEDGWFLGEIEGEDGEIAEMDATFTGVRAEN